MSAILAQLRQYQEAAKVSAEWSNLVSVEDIAKKAGNKSIKQMKVILKQKGLVPKLKIGGSYLYAKSELLEKFKAPIGEVSNRGRYMRKENGPIPVK